VGADARLDDAPSRRSVKASRADALEVEHVELGAGINQPKSQVHVRKLKHVSALDARGPRCD
jgi:hypothetical protein